MALQKQSASGWQDDRLMEAFDLIYNVECDNRGFGAESDFAALLNKIECLDELLKELRAEQVQP